MFPTASGYIALSFLVTANFHAAGQLEQLRIGESLRIKLSRSQFSIHQRRRHHVRRLWSAARGLSVSLFRFGSDDVHGGVVTFRSGTVSMFATRRSPFAIPAPPRRRSAA